MSSDVRDVEIENVLIIVSLVCETSVNALDSSPVTMQMFTYLRRRQAGNIKWQLLRDSLHHPLAELFV